MARGRPSEYTVWKARAICLRLIMGESLTSICKIEKYPSKPAVLRWLIKYDDFRTQYTQARELQQELFLDEIVDISDDGTNDWMKRQFKDGSEGWALNAEHVNRSRLRIDTRKWVMERMSPKKYGSRQQIDHSSSDGSMTPKGYSQEQYAAAQTGLSSELGDLD